MVANVQQVKCGQSDVTPCATCGKKTHGWWVQCQICQKWHHFNCVGVDESIRNSEWSCASCVDDEQGAPSSASENSMVQMVDLQKQFLDMVQTERESVKADREVQRQFLEMVQTEREAVQADRELQRQHLEIQKQQTVLQTKQLEDQRAYMEKLFKILVTSRESTSPQTSDTATTGSNDTSTKASTADTLVPNDTTEALNSLTRAMHQSQQRDLTTFSGDPAAWPGWIADYQLTSKQGKFSDVQNVNRLRKALKDNAKAAVQPYLNRGTGAETIIKILKSIYGREEELINKEASELLKLPAIQHKYDDRLPAFNIKLQNFVFMAKGQANITALSQPFIISELHNKFMACASHYDNIRSLREKNELFNIEDLSNYLDECVRKMPQQILLKCNFAKFLSPGSKVLRQQALSHDIDREEPSAQSKESKEKFRCPQCRAFHQLWRCLQFKKQSWSTKIDLLKNNDVCFKCLSSTTHKANECSLKGGCRVDGCGGNHNTIMHRPNKLEHVDEATTDDQPQGSKSQGLSSKSEPRSQLSHMNSNSMLFQIVPIKLYGIEGPIRTYAMLDPASSISMMERSIYDKLQLDGVDDVLHLKWTGGVTKEEVCKRVSLVISSTKGRKLHEIHNVYARDSLSLTPQCFDVSEMKQRYKHLRGLQLENLQDAVPTVMIGLEHANLLTGSKTVIGEPEEPVAMKTELGWVVFGKLDAHNHTVPWTQYHRTTATSYHHTRIEDDDVIAAAEVKKYFSTEGFGVTPTKAVVSEADQKAIDIMKSTLKRVGARYEIGLLWKDRDSRLPDSLPMALKRLQSEETSLKRKGLLEWKNNEMKNIITKGYARIATKEDLNTQWDRTWTAPTFVVVNENKHPPKPRNVTDVAAEVKGISLNKMLLKGPDNMTPLFAALFRLRQHQVAVNADVKEMFSQELIKPEDQQCQRILWRNGDQTQEPTTIIFERMVFGPVCSPSCAQFIKNYHASLHQEKYPEAAEILINATYVDDLFTSHPTVEEASRVIMNAIEICKDMSFDLVGVQSNSFELLKEIPTDHVKGKLVDFDAETDTYIAKVLGMYWDPVTDNFTFVFNEKHSGTSANAADYRFTKRQVLSTIMKIFDPLGMIAKYTLNGKLVLQDIWRTGIDWDDPVPEVLKETWTEFVTTVKHISKLRIPRHYSPGVPVESKITLVIFVDASEAAFAAAAYFRFESDDGIISSTLVMAKSRVAPIKPLSIPQLELQAAVLGVRVASTIQKLHTIKIERVMFLSDSKCVLMWISSKMMKFKSFVAVRIGEILESTTSSQWYHVGTNDNVADEATRPCLITEEKNLRWFQGPDFLKSPIKSWPISNMRHEKEDMIMSHQMKPLEYTLQPLKDIRARYKVDWPVFCRIIAWINRFIDTCRKTAHEKPTYILPRERQRAEDMLFKLIQLEAYPEDIQNLQERGRVADHSKLSGFCPIMGTDGIIRMSSRAQKASTSYATRNPAILPNKHPLTDIFIGYHHRRNMHMREETIIADIRTRAWIVNIRSAVRRVAANCQLCKNQRAKPIHPRMGQLPDERLQYGTKAFSFVGVDCFGPLLVKQGRATVKRYGIIFTCLVYRAVYLELLTDLSLHQVILAIRSLQARRGQIRVLFSDNGTNFIGARNQLVKDSKETMDKYGKTVADQLSIEWKFIPAYSPWMGGAWERLIRSIKRSLEFTLQGERPSEDTLRGALIQAELEMNRRPLTHNPVDHEDCEPLTPNHALFGSSGFDAQAVGEVHQRDRFAHSKDRQARHLGEKFRQRWIKEYLPTIMRRTKWTKDEKPIQLGDIVILAESDCPRRSWSKGRVTKLHHGPDKVVRTVDILLGDGSIKARRSVGRVAVLEVRKPHL